MDLKGDEMLPIFRIFRRNLIRISWLSIAKTKELNETKKRYNELVEQHQEKSRQHQKLQVVLKIRKYEVKSVRPYMLLKNLYEKDGPVVFLITLQCQQK